MCIIILYLCAPDSFGQIVVEMKQLDEFLIPFAGLKLGKHQFEFQIGKSFFEDFNFDEYDDVQVKVNVILEKKSTLLELTFKHQGTVNVLCDLTGEPFDLPIKGKINLLVKFGEEFNNDNEELLILPHGEHQLDVKQYIYEMIVLSVPQKKVHPGVKDGSLQTPALEKLKSLSVGEPKTEKESETDPRWDQLKKLLTDK